ncbi:MAG: hypothetical protein BM564_02340 [Bacteroidetes bacterium MedPE-SWsnd-G2]|nr:MAG: hypothetical protein BM564_02340 [Bacteroidetes bacterium MedPE-SWsnd-G2]
MNNSFGTIQEKLEQFVNRFYINELLKGTILFFAIGLLYFLFTLLIEHFLWLSSAARTVLFWVFIGVELVLLFKFIVTPILHLFKLKKGIDHETCSKIIGDYFPEVGDKLLNVLQLKQSQSDSDLLLASIDQKSKTLSPIPFKLAINFSANLKYLKYAAIPIVIIALFSFSGKFNWFSDSYERVVNYQTAYEPPAPFQFYVLNDSLTAIENSNYTLRVSTVGTVIPENIQILFDEQSYYLQSIGPGQFEYVFVQPKSTIRFSLLANDISSIDYSLKVINTPVLENFEMQLDYPSYTGKKDEVLKSTGNTIVPEGTTVTWVVNTRTTDAVSLYAKDTLNLSVGNTNTFRGSKQLFSNYAYSLSTSNSNLKNYENLNFNIGVIKDDYPELDLKMQRDSLDGESMYFYGQVSDDYGLHKLQMVYTPVNSDAQSVKVDLPVVKGNLDEFVYAFPNMLNLEKGVSYEVYFQVFDNDQINKYKTTKSAVFTYREFSNNEIEERQLKEQNSTIKDLNSSFEKMKDQEKELEEFSKTQKEKEELNFNDKKKFENFLKRQKNQDEMMKNFNKKLQNNLEEFQNESEEKDEFKEAIQKRLEENEEQLKKDEKLLDELEKLQEKIKKEELTQKLEQLAKQNKNKQKSLEQLLELTKRYYVAKKAEKLQQDLQQLAEKQEELSEKSSEENTKEAQEELNEEFEKLKEELDDLQKDNEQLQKPMDLPKDEDKEEEIKQEMQDATQDLEEKEKQEKEGNEAGAQAPQAAAKKKQKKAAQKMKEMSNQMSQAMQSGGEQQAAEDIDVLRQILDNLILFSFDQEDLMNSYKKISVNHNSYGAYLRKQNDLKTHFEHVDDSLFALSLRQPMISEQVNTQVTNVFFTLNKSLAQLSENQLYQAISSQQYTITSTNNLASFLSDILDNMENQMNPSIGQGQGQGMQLPDIIKSQEELNKEMQEGKKKSDQGKPKKDGEKGKEGEEGQGAEGESGSEGEQKNGKNGEPGGEGEGESEYNSEEMNGELFKIYKRQAELRQALQDRLAKDGFSKAGEQLLKDMKEIELDLLNKGFTDETLSKMMELEHQLLKLENATLMQGEDNKRESETNTKSFNKGSKNKIPTAKEYFNTIEILNRQGLPLQQIYKKKVQDYFNTNND